MRLLKAGLFLALVVPAAMALADTRAGVDAWSRGDYKAAVEAWRPAAIAGDADAEFNLAQAYKLGRGVPADLGLAESWYRKAALQGHPEAETNYGLVLFQAHRLADALPWLEKSADRGEPRAQLVLGTMLYNGDGVARDWPRAYALIVRSAASGSAPASEVQAEMDRYITAEDRQKGLELARQYEAQARRPVLPPEIAGASGGKPIRGVDLPSNHVAPPMRQAPSPAATVPRPAVTAATKSTPGNGKAWRLQLGAFKDEGNAKALWTSLKTRVGALRSLEPAYVHAGAVTRLQAGPLASRGDAAKACAAIKPTGNACLPVAP